MIIVNENILSLIGIFFIIKTISNAILTKISVKWSYKSPNLLIMLNCLAKFPSKQSKKYPKMKKMHLIYNDFYKIKKQKIILIKKKVL